MIGLDPSNIDHDIENPIYLQIILVILNNKISQIMALLLIDPSKTSKVLVL